MAAKQSQSSVALPGLESVVMPLDVRPADADMSDAKTFTAAVLFRDHPRVFRSACELLFRNGLSVRSVSAALYLSVNTVRAIRDMVLASDGRTVDAAAAAFFVKSRVSQARRIVQLRALEAVEDKLNDIDELKKTSIDTLISAVKSIEEIEKAEESKKPEKINDEIIDVDVDAFDSVLDGLNSEKKCAREDGLESSEDGADSVADAAETIPGGCCQDELYGDFDVDKASVGCSTSDKISGGVSSQLSVDAACLRGFPAPLCNSLCNSVRNPSGPAANRIPADDSPAISRPASAGDFRPTPAAGSTDTPPRGRGGGGCAAAGGVD